MSSQYLSIKGAKEHNLKNINVEIPKNKLTVITGLSGSGKSSLAFDTIYAEGQRRYVESLSSYARQFLELMPKPDVDSIAGLSPAISIEQRTTSKNPRSTVGTVTEIYDYLRLLYARVGVPYSPATGLPIESQSVSQMVDAVLKFDEGTRVYIISPIVRGKKGEHRKEIELVRKQGFQRVKINNEIYAIEDIPDLDKNIKHNISVVIDRLVIKPEIKSRLADSIEIASKLSDGIVFVEKVDLQETVVFSEKFSCPESGFCITEIEPRLFSFNSPFGSCQKCSGLGVNVTFASELIVPNDNISITDGAIAPWRQNDYFWDDYTINIVNNYCDDDIRKPFKNLKENTKNMLLYGATEKVPTQRYGVLGIFYGIIPKLKERWKTAEKPRVKEELAKYQMQHVCDACGGYRLNKEALCVRINDKHIGRITDLSIDDAIKWFNELPDKLSDHKNEIAIKILKEISARLHFLQSVGLSYLSLSRSSGTLSGGESQRIRLASQIGSGLTGVLYVLDEPSIGLHQRDNARLIDTLKKLRDLGNTVIVVEHDLDTIKEADFVIDIGPKAGVHGGRITAQGSVQEIAGNDDSLTGQYLTGTKQIAVPGKLRAGHKDCFIKLIGATANNLQNVSLTLPLGKFVSITGVSGGGKSSLIIETLYQALHERLNSRVKKNNNKHYDKLLGVDNIDKVIDIDQSPIGKTPRSNPATYTGVFTNIREWFAGLPESKAKGYTPGRFSFNVKGGRCETCQGDGVIKIEMHFLPDVYIECDQCKGARYNKETLEIEYRDRSIADILRMTVDEGVEFFEHLPNIASKLKTLQHVGLGYINIGQQATTLSGGEAQRVKLAKELAKRSTGSTLYILDEPTTGLHTDDVKKLLEILHSLVDQGNTVVVIEHNLDVIKTSDWIVDVGPEGGEKGGKIVACGAPQDIIKIQESYTGKYLKELL